MRTTTENVEEQVQPRQSNKLGTVLSLAVGIIGCVLGSFAVYQSSNTPKISFVQSAELVYGYDGMKEAQQQFQNKQRVWQANLDTLQMDFQRAVNQYNNEFAQLPEKEKQQRELQLRKQEEQLMQYERTLKDKAADEDRKMSQTVLDQISGYIKEYRNAHNYDIILGTTNGESVIAGSDRIDITKDLLQYINQKYKSSARPSAPSSPSPSK